MPDTNMLIREGMALSDVKLRPGEAGPSQGEKTGESFPRDRPKPFKSKLSIRRPSHGGLNR